MKIRFFYACIAMVLGCGLATAQSGAPAAAVPANPASSPAPVVAAPATPVADVASKQDVMNLLAALKVKENIANMLEGMRLRMKQGERRQIAGQRLTATDAQMSQIDGMIDGLFKQVPLDEMLDAMVPVYQKHLSKTEMAAISAFYTSPAGLKLLSEQPAMMEEGFQAGGSLMDAHMKPLMAQLDAQLQKVEAEMTPAPEPAAAPAPARSKRPAAKAGASKAGAAKPAPAKPAATPKP